MNERQMQTTEEKVDTSKALYASLVDTERSRIESKEHDTSSRSGNDAQDDGVDIRPIYDEEPMAMVQTTAKINVFTLGQQHTEQPEFNNKGEENKILKKHYKELFDSIKITSDKTIEHTTSLIGTNDKFKAQLQEKRISSKNLPRFSSNDMVHNHYLEEAKKKTQEHKRNSEPSLMPSSRSQSTTNGSKPKPRSNTQTSRNWSASKSSFTMTKTVPIAEHPRNSKTDSCVTKFLKEVNSRAKVPSN
nr:hypothetical protein [Tanacetum cinerariifolium]